MNDFLSKPYTQAQLGKVLARWLPNKSAPNEHEASTSFAILEALEATEDDSGHRLVLDQAALDNIRALQQPGEPDILPKIIRRFVENGPQLLQTMREAITQQDTERVRLAARNLKSSSANLGATALSDLCKTLEIMVREQRLAQAEALLDEIETIYITVAKELENNCGLNRQSVFLNRQTDYPSYIFSRHARVQNFFLL